MSLDPASHAAFCRAEDADTLANANYERFLEWRQALSQDEELQYALDFITGLKTATGVMRAEHTLRAPWLGKLATVEFSGADQFDDFLNAKWAALPEASR